MLEIHCEYLEDHVVFPMLILSVQDYSVTDVFWGDFYS